MGQRIDISRAKEHLSGMLTRGGRSVRPSQFKQILKSNKDVQSSPTLRKAAYKIARSKNKKATVSRDTFKRLSKAMVKHGREGFKDSGVKRVSLSKQGRKAAKGPKSFTKKVINEQKEAEKPEGPSKKELERQEKIKKARKNLNVRRRSEEIEKEQGRFNPRKSEQSPAEQKQEGNKQNSIDQPSSVPLSSGGVPQPNKASAENQEYFSPVQNEENLKNTEKSSKIVSLEEKKQKISENKEASEESTEEPPDEGLFAA